MRKEKRKDKRQKTKDKRQKKTDKRIKKRIRKREKKKKEKVRVTLHDCEWLPALLRPHKGHGICIPPTGCHGITLDIQNYKGGDAY